MDGLATADVILPFIIAVDTVMIIFAFNLLKFFGDFDGVLFQVGVVGDVFDLSGNVLDYLHTKQNRKLEKKRTFLVQDLISVVAIIWESVPKRWKNMATNWMIMTEANIKRKTIPMGSSWRYVISTLT